MRGLWVLGAVVVVLLFSFVFALVLLTGFVGGSQLRPEVRLVMLVMVGVGTILMFTLIGTYKRVFRRPPPY